MTFKINSFRYLYKSLIIICLVTFFWSCSAINDSPDPPAPEELGPAQTTILIYAVATNSLTGNLVSDKREMLQAASSIDLSKNNIYIFETQYKYLEDNTRIGNVALLKLVKASEPGEYKWETVREYNDGIASLDPNRIREIIYYVTDNNESEHYGLIFWSHSTASQPYFDDSTRSTISTQEVGKVSLPMQYSFGQDLSYANGDPHYQINIDDLAKAVPDNLFDFIWFDSCYMSNIETIYQFRNKCQTFVGYPTEVLDDGLPYQYVMPKMVGESPDLIEAAKAFFNYYSTSFATIAVVDMNKIETFAEDCRNLYSKINVPNSALMKFSRYSTGPFYDLGDYTKELVNQQGNELSSQEWDEILKECVLYKATTSGVLLGLSLNAERFSGISTHLYSFIDNESESETYYKSLDWYKAVF